jgi:tRNA-Thr(GGU) m(6)t(6)A37 methyltransferase TsaA
LYIVFVDDAYFVEGIRPTAIVRQSHKPYRHILARNKPATMPDDVLMKPVGYVRNSCDDPESARRLQSSKSIIEVDESLVDALFMIDSCEYLDVVYHFHLPESVSSPSWRRTTKTGEVRGVFASRSPVRPNRIGITTVRLVARDGNKLQVTGLDAVNGTPVLDIKSCNTSHLDDELCGAKGSIHTSLLKSNPRLTIQRHIMAGDTEKLLMLAAQIHGHYCPGLAMGVMAAVHAMKQLDCTGGPNKNHAAGKKQPDSDLTEAGKHSDGKVSEGQKDADLTTGNQTSQVSDGLEDLLAIVETNNCFADGVQLVTGCSFGNNSLIFEDLGKTAFTLTRRDGNGVRVISRHESPAYVREVFPEFDRHYQRVVRDQVRDEASVAAFRKSGVERSFGTLGLDFNRMFDVQRARVDVPDYAPSHESGVCARCGDSVMATRMVDVGAASTRNAETHAKYPAASTRAPDVLTKDSDTSTKGLNKPETTAGSRKLCLKCAGEPYRVLDGHGIRTAGKG